MTAMVPLYVKVSRAPEVFGLSRSTVYRLAERGELHIYKRGGGSFLKVAEVSAWIESGAGSE